MNSTQSNVIFDQISCPMGENSDNQIAACFFSATKADLETGLKLSQSYRTMLYAGTNFARLLNIPLSSDQKATRLDLLFGSPGPKVVQSENVSGSSIRWVDVVQSLVYDPVLQDNGEYHVRIEKNNAIVELSKTNYDFIRTTIPRQLVDPHSYPGDLLLEVNAVQLTFEQISQWNNLSAQSKGGHRLSWSHKEGQRLLAWYKENRHLSNDSIEKEYYRFSGNDRSYASLQSQLYKLGFGKLTNKKEGASSKCKGSEGCPAARPDHLASDISLKSVDAAEVTLAMKTISESTPGQATCIVSAEKGEGFSTNTAKCSQTLGVAADDNEWLNRGLESVDGRHTDSKDGNANQAEGMSLMVSPQAQTSIVCSQNVERQSINLSFGSAEYQENKNLSGATSAFSAGSQACPAAKRNSVAGQYNFAWSVIGQAGQTNEKDSVPAVSLNGERREEPNDQGTTIAPGPEPVNNSGSKRNPESTQKRQGVLGRKRGAGCITCGRQRKTCDGTRPSCQNCTEAGLDRSGHKEVSQGGRGNRMASRLPKDGDSRFHPYPSNDHRHLSGSAGNSSSAHLSSVEGYAQTSDMDMSACGAGAHHLPTQAPTAVQSTPRYQNILSIQHLLLDPDAGTDVGESLT
ncbi:uncharacterized protein N7483_002440 [Penicillium malachiteum]|uniref:uncharacterized protein n=1 Tax=Penicillium malachiteum TaxID=1324776 RepID=UPI002547A7C8|nr:uncharacterized protein N7483_002440 [Penicillium malachiteum]KAJ5737315.1 hypothetical protein N7483_002440 [Penicillium malachiteum]